MSEPVLYEHPDGVLRDAWGNPHGEVEAVATEEEEEAEDDEEEIDYDALTVRELRAELSGRGLDIDGNKPDLVERLLDADREG